MRPVLIEKNVLNPEETVRLFGLSRRRFMRLISTGKRLSFLAFYKKRKLIIRTEFEQFLEENPEKKEELRNGDRKPWHEKT